MMPNDLKALGLVIAQARKSASLTQEDLARALHMSRATISGIENGTVGEIGIRKVLAICGALGVELVARPRHARPTLDDLREERRERAART